jgi:hypothetical protein
VFPSENRIELIDDGAGLTCPEDFTRQNKFLLKIGLRLILVTKQLHGVVQSFPRQDAQISFANPQGTHAVVTLREKFDIQEIKNALTMSMLWRPRVEFRVVEVEQRVEVLVLLQSVPSVEERLRQIEHIMPK